MTEQEQILKTENSFNGYGSTMEALRRAEEGLPDLSTSYDGEIRSLYEKIVNRPAFRYDAGSDPLYGMYRDSYVREGRMAMRDTIGQTSHLTGGYGSSYAQRVGQQQYGAYLQKLGDAMPELYGAALKRWQAEGEALSDKLGKASALAGAEYGRKKDAFSMAGDVEQKDYDRRWAAYQSLISVITQSGYEPKDQELQDSGMSRELADALRQEYLRANGLLPSSGGGGAVSGPVWTPSSGGGKSSKSSKSGNSGGAAASKEAVKLTEPSNPEKTRRR